MYVYSKDKMHRLFEMGLKGTHRLWWVIRLKHTVYLENLGHGIVTTNFEGFM